MIKPINGAPLILPPHMPTHGGALHRASAEFAIEPEKWIDLSTGISPNSWPVPALPEQVWRSLPDAEDNLLATAASYYGCRESELLPISGSQFAIEQIPQLIKTAAVAVPVWGYAEHSYRWQLAGHQLHWYSDYQELEMLVSSGQVNSAVVINPNNPSTELLTQAKLLKLLGILQTRQGNLLVDEAFMDSCAEHSLCNLLADRPCPAGLIILRSVGKFFGLAGIRLGFVIASGDCIQRLEQRLSPWAVNHIARWVGRHALTDSSWQQQQRQSLVNSSTDWRQQLQQLLPSFHWHRSDCFITAFADRQQCESLYRQLGQSAVLVRLLCSARDGLRDIEKSSGYSDGAALRFGLPSPNQQPTVVERISALEWQPLCAD